MIDVLYDHQIFALQPIGGISRYFAELLPRMRDHGVAAHLHRGLHINRFAFDARRLASLGGWRRPTRHTGRLVAPVNRALCRRAFRRVRPQLYHSTLYPDCAPPEFGGPRVVTVHDLTDTRTGRTDVGSPFSVSATRGRRVDGYVCISETTRRDLIELYQVDPAKTTVVHHASDLAPDPAAPAPHPRPYVLHVGGRGGYKNFDALLAAFARSPRLSSAFDLLAFGHAPSPAERERYATAAPSVRLAFAGGDDRALAAAYVHARAFVYPSRYEGFGMPLLEAMRCDCPVVASDASCFPEIAGDAAEYFDPLDAASIAESIESVVFDDARRAALLAAGRARRAAFSWDRAAAETAAFYRQLLGEDPPRAGA